MSKEHVLNGDMLISYALFNHMSWTYVTGISQCCKSCGGFLPSTTIENIMLGCYSSGPGQLEMY